MAEEDDETAEEPTPSRARRSRKAKKERVLHTRVPAVLEQELKNLADSWRMPVSNVVRAILEDALDTVDLVGQKAEGEILGVAQRLASERERLKAPLRPKKASEPPPSESSARGDEGAAGAGEAASGDGPAAKGTDEESWDRSVIEGAVGFSALILAHDTTCPVTGDRMKAGEKAYLVMFAEPGRHAVVSPRVVPAGA